MHFKATSAFFIKPACALITVVCVCTPLLALSIDVNTSITAEPDWSEGSSLTEDHRENIYKLNQTELQKSLRNGALHAHQYPVNVTGMALPAESFRQFFATDQNNPLRLLVNKIIGKVTGYETEDDFYRWLGLVPIENLAQMSSPYTYLGASIIEIDNTKAVTFSCFACHASQLFGHPVIGLQNRHSKANELFVLGKTGLSLTTNTMFKMTLNSSPSDLRLFSRSRQNVRAVGALKPQVLGLDTSLAQVALSLAHRNPDAYASKSSHYEASPRPNELKYFVADSKPMPWWNVKYKTRWLSDGSIVSGNPILTNFLWNEIGRGADLYDLNTWMFVNRQVIQDLTAFVFATKPPRWKDIFPEYEINIVKARAGEKIFLKLCSSCHGIYEKAWSTSKHAMSDLMQTTRVIYSRKTQVMDVGTDPQRAQGMNYFATQLNQLTISKQMKTKVVPQKGYVPPPLVAIWSRYPYLHNNSIPNLCEMMTAPQKRSRWFVHGPADNKQTDFNLQCVGYPTGGQIPEEWMQKQNAIYQTGKPGLSNQGHYAMFLDPQGKEILNLNQKFELIEFLKTL